MSDLAPITSSQRGIITALQAGARLTEQRHKVIQKPYFEVGNAQIRRDAVAALLAHGLIERGAEPREHDYYLANVLRGHYDIWHWTLTAKGKEWA